jgi:hypothetical protein
LADDMKKSGVKGIRYLDGGHAVRQEVAATTLVAFDDSLINILKRYGIPMTAAAGGGMLIYWAKTCRLKSAIRN